MHSMHGNMLTAVLVRTVDHQAETLRCANQGFKAVPVIEGFAANSKLEVTLKGLSSLSLVT